MIVSFNVRFSAGVTQMSPEKPGRVERPQGMDGWILNQSVEGAGLIRGAAEAFRAAPGELLLFPPGVPHLYAHDPGTGLWTHQWAYFFPRPHWLEWLDWPARPPGVASLRLEGDAHVEAGRLFERIIELSTGTLPLKFELAMNKLEELLLLCEAARPKRAAAGVDPRVAAALRRMEAEPAARHSLASLARGAAMSKSRFSHLFKAELGDGPMRRLEALRMRRAQELLFLSTKTLSEIAEDCGYANVFHFSRVFKAVVGMPPGQFRKVASG